MKSAKPAATAFDRLGVDLSKAKDADLVQSAIKGGVERARSDIASAPGVAPSATERQSTQAAAESLGQAHATQKAAEQQRWQHARNIGSSITVDGVSNIQNLQRIIGEDVAGLKGQGVKSVQDLKAQRLRGEGEVLDARDKVFELEQAHTAGEDVGPLMQAKADLKGKRLENARAILEKKITANADLDAQIAEAEKAAKEPRKGGMPTQIKTAEDLIDLKQHLNKINTTNFSSQELSRHQAAKAEVDAALQEIAERKPDMKGLRNSKLPLQDPNKLDFGDALKKANAQTELVKTRYEGDAAKQLGVDKDLLASLKKTGSSTVGKDAATNAIAGTTGIVNRIKSTAHVDWLKDNMSARGFNQLMSDKIKSILADVGTDPEALRDSRELVDHILKEGVGLKGTNVTAKLDDLQAVLDKLSPQQAGASLKMAPKGYRGSDPAITRALNAAKAAAATVAGHGKPSTYSIAKGAEAFAPGGTAEAKRLMKLRKELYKKPPQDITGPAIGAFVGGNAGDNSR